jgi:hypothetical protein
MTYAIANHHGSNFQTEQTYWLTFDKNNQCIGRIIRIAAWAVPAVIHAGFSLPNHIDLYITSEGQWTQTLEIAEHLLTTESSPEEFVVKGSALSS